MRGERGVGSADAANWRPHPAARPHLEEARTNARAKAWRNVYAERLIRTSLPIALDWSKMVIDFSVL